MASPLPALVVLAAGMGSRYGGLKQLDPVGPEGETLLDYSVFDAIRGGFGRVVFVIREEMAGAFESQIGAKFSGRVEVSYVFQNLADVPGQFEHGRFAARAKPWGTAHATMAARSAVPDRPFGVINADDFYGADAYRKLAQYFAALRDPVGSTDFAMVAFTLANTLSEHGTVARGLCRVDDDGWLRSVEELTRLADHPGRGLGHEEPDGSIRPLLPDDLVSMNMWGFTPAAFPLFEREFARFLEQRGDDPKSEFYIPTAIDALVASGEARVRVLRTDAEWFGVTYRDDRARVIRAIRQRVENAEYPAPLWG